MIPESRPAGAKTGSAISALQVKGEAAPKSVNTSVSLSATVRLNRPINSHLVQFNKPYPFGFDSQNTTDLTVTGLSGPSVPVRKMEHLSRVRTANFGMSSMDSNFDFSAEPESAFVIEKPHFVLCGVPIGAKEIDHHLYVTETRVGNFKTSAQALYKARRGIRSGKARSEPLMPSVDKTLINSNTNLPDAEVNQKSIPPIPPTTPVNYAHYVAMMKPKAGKHSAESAHFHGSIPSVEIENNYIPSDLMKHKKVTLVRREKTADSLDLQREHSTVSMRSVETVSESVVNNSLTVTTGKGARLVSRSAGNIPGRVNYNNPYRHTKHKERVALNGNKRLEFNSLDTYLKYQKQHHQNGRHFMTPRAILRIPKPCSDTFLLQMMYELNRPLSRRSTATKYSDIARIRDLEEMVHTRTSSSLSKAQSNIDRYMGKVSSGKSVKSAATDTIEEEEDTIKDDDQENDTEATSINETS